MERLAKNGKHMWTQIGTWRHPTESLTRWPEQQLEMLQSNPSPAELAEKTIDYAEAKAAYFKALRAEIPELLKIATGKESRPPELGTFTAAFAVAGEKQKMVADQETLVLLKRFSNG